MLFTAPVSCGSFNNIDDVSIESQSSLKNSSMFYEQRNGWYHLQSTPSYHLKFRWQCGHGYCIRTLPRGGMYWKIHSPRPKRFPKGGDFAPRGPRCIPTRGSVRTFFQNQQGSIDFVVWQQMALASVRLWFANKKPMKRNPFHIYA